MVYAPMWSTIRMHALRRPLGGVSRTARAAGSLFDTFHSPSPTSSLASSSSSSTSSFSSSSSSSSWPPRLICPLPQVMRRARFNSSAPPPLPPASSPSPATSPTTSTTGKNTVSVARKSSAGPMLSTPPPPAAPSSSTTTPAHPPTTSIPSSSVPPSTPVVPLGVPSTKGAVGGMGETPATQPPGFPPLPSPTTIAPVSSPTMLRSPTTAPLPPPTPSIGAGGEVGSDDPKKKQRLGLGGDRSTAFPSLSLRSVPRVPLALGVAGLVPFAFATVGAYSCAAPDIMAYQLLEATYGASLLSFLGAVHWGTAVAGYGDSARLNGRYVWSVLPALLGFATLSCPPDVALALQGGGMGALLIAEVRGWRHGSVPSWYPALRFWLSVAAMGSLGAVWYADRRPLAQAAFLPPPSPPPTSAES